MTDRAPDPAADAPEDPLGPPAGATDDLTDGAAPSGPVAEAEPGADSAPVDSGGTPPADPGGPPSVEQLIADLERTTTERDDYLDALRRNQAEFENYKKRVARQQADDAARAAERLVEDLLPVLDACDSAIHLGASEVEPVYATLLGTLEKQGLERIDPVGEPFDPNLHEAVMHEPAQEGDEGTVVGAVMRAGYAWKGRVVRPAMVKVRG